MTLKNQIQKNAFLFFLGLTLLISWLPWILSGSGFFVFGPSIAGVITIALTKGKTGMEDLSRRALQWRVGLRWWAVALLISGLIGFIAIGINLLLGGAMPTFRFFREEWYLIPVFFLLTIIGGPLGEEFGWRGFALPNLQEKWGALRASVLLGTIWALWHFPLFFQEGSIHEQMGFGLLPVYLIGEIALATMMTWVYNKTGGSLLVGGIILHNADNLWATLLYTSETMTSAFAGGEQALFDPKLYLISTVVSLAVALTILIVTKWNLGYENPRN